MKLKINLAHYGIDVTLTYFPGDGELIFNPDKVSGIIRNKYGDNKFTIIQN